jgi:hypothetical protein
VTFPPDGFANACNSQNVYIYGTSLSETSCDGNDHNLKEKIQMRLLWKIASCCAALNISLCAADDSFIGPMHTIKAHASTVPRNGDVNPYGVAVVPNSTGLLEKEHILVSNFNNAANLQGTGTTIVQVSPGDGSTTLFAQIDASRLPGACPGGVGLTTALAVLRSGWVIVGSLPTTDGTVATAQAGCLIVLNSWGNVVETISGGDLNGPWDMTALDEGTTAVLFVTNVLNGTVAAAGQTVSGGTVLQIGLTIPAGGMPMETSRTVIGSGFGERTDPNALVIGPTGVGLGANGTLYVADTSGNRITAIENAIARTTNAGTGTTVSGGGALNGPLGLAIAPNGNILTVNGADGNMVETTPAGVQVATKAVDVTETGSGTLFGLAIRPSASGVYFVNDGNNTLDLMH